LIKIYPLVLPAIMRCADALFVDKDNDSRLPEKSYHLYTYAVMMRRANRLTKAHLPPGNPPLPRFYTLAWNHYQHLEAYFGIPAFGGVLHTLNLRLPPQDLIYVANHAEDRVILVDESLLPLFQKIRPQLNVEHVVVISNEGNEHEGTIGYEQLLASADPSEYREPNLDENQAAAMCYTSGTTGRPQRAVRAHRPLVPHCFGCLLPDASSLRETDVVTPVVPMFHVNAWGLPFTCTMVGAKQVFPGPHLDPVSLAELFQAERVTVTAGVPTIWLGLLQLLDSNPGAYDLSSMRAMLIGGQAAPEGMIRGFRERHNLHVV